MSKTSSSNVCLTHESQGFTMICPNWHSGGYGPVVGYLFTDEHLLVRTLGAKPSEHDPGRFTSDPDREHFFIVDRKDHYPYDYLPLGPLSRAEFSSHPAVPPALDWQRPINPNGWVVAIFVVLMAGVVLLYYVWPFLLIGLVVLVVRAVLRRRRSGRAARARAA